MRPNFRKRKRGAPGSSFLHVKDLNSFFDLGSFTHTAAQIIQLCSANFTVADNFHLINDGRMHREYLFHTDAIRNAADGEGFFNTAMLLCNDSAFKNLNSFAATFFYLNVNLDLITDCNFGMICLDLRISQCFHQIHGSFLLKYRRSCRILCLCFPF